MMNDVLCIMAMCRWLVFLSTQKPVQRQNVHPSTQKKVNAVDDDGA